MAMDWEDRSRYGRGGNERGRGASRQDRDWTDRAGDEMRSWFGDEDAERRRYMEGRRQGSQEYRGQSEDYGYADRGATVGDYGRSRQYGGYEDRDRSSQRGYGREGQYGYPSRNDMGPDFGGGGWAMERGRGQYGRGGRDYGSHGSEERGFMERAGDEVASWFGDEDAQRRREMDAGHRGRGPRGYTRSDERIREDVNDRLSDDPHIDASDIEVSVSDCEVTLSGQVNERFAKRHAEDIAERVSGVKHVQNNLRIAAQQSSTDRMSGTTTGSMSGERRTPGSSVGHH